MILFKLLVMLKPFLMELLLGNKKRKRDTSVFAMVLMVFVMFICIFFMNASTKHIRDELTKNRDLANSLSVKIVELQSQATECRKDQDDYRNRLKESQSLILAMKESLEVLGKPTSLPKQPEKVENKESSLLNKLNAIEE